MNSYAQLCIVIHTYHYIFALLKANCTLKVGRWSPCPVLQQQARVFTPLSNGEGMGVGLFLWLLEDGARRPPSYLKYALFVLLVLRLVICCFSLYKL